ncbi:MAG: NFACT family protein [Vampirovibrionales bacterium]
MQPLDALTIKHLARELDVKLSGGKISKIHQSHFHDLFLHCWVGGQARHQKLYVSIKPELAFCTLLDNTAFLSFPKQPQNFCLLLRKRLQNGCIERVEALEAERVINLHISNVNAIGQTVAYVLSLELMGKHSNIILVDAATGLIDGCAHGVSSTMSQHREVAPGLAYTEPPKPTKRPLAALTQQEWMAVLTAAGTDDAKTHAAFLAKTYAGFGQRILEQVFWVAPGPQAAHTLLHELMGGAHLAPCLGFGHVGDGIPQAFSLLDMTTAAPSVPSALVWQRCPSVCAMVAGYFLPVYGNRQFQQVHQQLAQIVANQLAKLDKRLAELEASLETEAIETLRHKGDALTAMLYQSAEVRPGGQKTIEACHPQTGEVMTIALDAKLNLSDNAQRYYRLFKKAQRRAEKNRAFLTQVVYQREFAEAQNDALNRAETLDDLQFIRQDLKAMGWFEARRSGGSSKKAEAQPALLTVTSSDGFSLVVGKNHVQNDWLLGKVARGHDVWVHVQHMPGAHVVVRTNKQAVPDQTLLEAAELAAWFSKAQHSTQVPVIYTEVKHVRKIPDSYPGHVTYTHEQEIVVSPSDALLGAAGSA